MHIDKNGIRLLPSLIEIDLEQEFVKKPEERIDIDSELETVLQELDSMYEGLEHEGRVHKTP